MCESKELWYISVILEFQIEFYRLTVESFLDYIYAEEFLVQIKMSTRGVLDRNSKLCDWPESSFRTNENSWYRWWAKMMKQILSVLPRPSTYLVRYIIIRCMIVNYLTRGSHLGFVIEIITLEVLQAPSKALDRLRGLGFRFQDGVLTLPPPFLVHWP